MLRLSAILIRGNGAVERDALGAHGLADGREPSGGGGLCHQIPEGDSAYELLVR